eukprot:5649097-Amphidinium_carterae.1
MDCIYAEQRLQGIYLARCICIKPAHCTLHCVRISSHICLGGTSRKPCLSMRLSSPATMKVGPNPRVGIRELSGKKACSPQIDGHELIILTLGEALTYPLQQHRK